MLQFLLNRRRVILLIIVPLFVAGIYFLGKMPIKMYPNMRKSTVMVNIPHPSYTAEDFYDEFRDTLEPKLNAIEGVESIQSTYNSGRTRYQIEFDWNIDFDTARSEVISAMDSIKSSLPSESDSYSVSSWRGATGFMSLAVYSNEISTKELYDIVEPVLKVRLAQINDAESVTVVNIEELNTEIILRPSDLLTYGYTPDDVASAVRSGYKHTSIGSFRENRNVYNLRVKTGIDGVYEVENILVGIKGNKEIVLKDLADVKIYSGLPRNLYSANGERSIMIFATPKEDGNINSMSKDILTAIDELKKDLPSHVQFQPLIDPAVFINRAVKNVINAALVGSLLAIIIIIIFLGEWKNVLIISLSIPLSIVYSFILMYIFDVSINLISLSGMTLAVGMIIDSSIVIMENIHRHRLDRHGQSIKDIVLVSVGEVRASIIGSTITSVCVFLPLSFTAPLTNAILGDLAKTVIFALSCSMGTALIVTPVVAYYLFRNEEKCEVKESRLAKMSEWIVSRMIGFYTKILKSILTSRLRSYTVLLSSFFLLILLIIFVAPKIRMEIVADPRSDRVSVRFTNNSTLDKEALLDAFMPYEKQVLAKLGNRVESRFSNIFNSSTGNLLITLKSSKLLDNAIDDLKDILQNNDDWTFDIAAWDPSKLPLPRTYGLHMKVNGSDKKVILGIMEQVMDSINKLDLYRSVSSVPSTRTTEEIMLLPRKEVIQEFPGLSVSKLSGLIKILLNGTQVISMNENDTQITISMNYAEGMVSSITDILNYQIPYKDKSIPLKHFFNYTINKGIAEIRNDNGEETFNIYGEMRRGVADSKKKGFEKMIQESINKDVKLPAGYTITFEDTQKIINESVSSLITAIIISIVLIYLVLGLQFNSLKIPLIILVTIPLGFIGVIGSLYIFNSTISLNSMLGTILLGGIVVNNAIILLDFYISYRKKMDDKLETLLTVAKLRFTPILITTATTLLGMLPIALAIGDGTNIIQPLGISVSGGLLVSTMLTLIIIPVVLNLLPDFKNSEN
ncbi:MAG: hypothetical protein A2015_08460 [Spirochaetes bacterium GWF1_31_7]|nr:MAG: hypothetical protein A2Y30_08655 [Spirochaetes bacterium GWE1_32_154]OHD47178.1 MAG: hypothetical protein A2015_08460 [Spirochaetes bacterium GWF1_31_7]OHD47489.1 MAG: hypothetical protein A2Y29_08880 [Spirochaetes bacterium GWE2_31_10]OHD82323.1 MAG: hypothetical protein A2355_15290 [Spirochaetes bacterium RIFOXYB1_FULL_32_8]HBD92576.1 hypothetical protein [Spirochaetia bacterium]